MLRVIAPAIVLILSAAPWRPAGAEEELSPDQPYAGGLSSPVTYDVEFTAVVTPPYRTKVLKVWLPLPPSDNVQQVIASTLSTYPSEVEPQIAVEPMYGNRFACWEFTSPQGAQTVRHTFTVKVHEVRWNLDPAGMRAVSVWPESFAAYLRPVAEVASAPDYRAVLDSVSAAKGSFPVFAAMDWIHENLTYDHVESSLRGSADWAFAKRRGHCSDYHGLCQTFGRSLGTPARVTYGIHLFPKNSPSHCKLEAFLPPYGWISFDLSETQKQVKAIAADATLSAAEKEALIKAASRRLRAGFRDNTWMLWTRGTHYELAPKASQPVAVVRTIYAEADGEPLPDPDPANSRQRTFGWMTVHKYTPDREVEYPFRGTSSLAGWK